MPDKSQPYRSYLLRIWRSGEAGSSRRLASLEDTRTGERRGFASLEEVFAFLEKETGAALWAAQPSALRRWRFEDEENAG